VRGTISELVEKFSQGELLGEYVVVIEGQRKYTVAV
jgi:16S rRNA C1402 (ribose-2'-O) methylase RsmI